MTDTSNDAMILPGELLSTVLSHPVKLGPGLRLNGFNADEPIIQATQAGVLHKTKHSEFYVDYISHRVFRPAPTVQSVILSTYQVKENPS